MVCVTVNQLGGGGARMGGSSRPLWQKPDFSPCFPLFFHGLNYRRASRSKYGEAEENRGENRRNTTVSVPVPTDTLLQLIEKLRRRGGSQDAATPTATMLDGATAVAPPALASTSTLPTPQAPSPLGQPPRNTDREPGWDLPERRKFRYRLEDVAC
jgi:hypothetical protein